MNTKAATKPSVSCCRVDAAGLPAEWIEATVAREDQPTIVYFFIGDGVNALERSRSRATELAVMTGARVLTVACSSHSLHSHLATIGQAIAAFTWLLAEGSDVDSTAFTSDPPNAWLLEAVLAAAEARGMPVPSFCAPQDPTELPRWARRTGRRHDLVPPYRNTVTQIR